MYRVAEQFDIFLYVYWSFGYLLWCRTCSCLLPVLLLGYLCYWFVEVLYIFRIWVLCQIFISQTSSPSLWTCLFFPLNGLFWGSQTRSRGWTSMNSNWETMVQASQLMTKIKVCCVALGITRSLQILLGLSFLSCKWDSLWSSLRLFGSEISFFCGLRMMTWDGDIPSSDEQGWAGGLTWQEGRVN